LQCWQGDPANNAINEAARGDPDALAVRIVAALGEAGYRVVPANGIKDTALGSRPEKCGIEQLYREPERQTRFLPATHLQAWPLSGIRRMSRQVIR
jgi:hypothetical protein